MEARFIVLQPDDPGEILWTTVLIRCLKTQVEGALVYPVVKESNRWLLENNPHQEEIFTYRENPKELLEELKDFLPDYLIDLDGRREVRRFKNRLKVLDFTIKREKPGTTWLGRAFDTCRLFDVHDDGMGRELGKSEAYRDLLPRDFLDGYIVLSLDNKEGKRTVSEEVIIRLAVMTEKPIVVTGSRSDRDLANRIGQSTGCAVFPACGDLSMAETLSVLAHAKGAFLFESVWVPVAETLKVPCTLIREHADEAGLQELALWARSFFNPGHGRTTV